MIITKIKFAGPLGDLAKLNLGRSIRLGGLGNDKYSMMAIGQVGIKSIKERVAKGVGSGDTPMKPLVDRYAKWKTKIGKQPIRDLYGPGAQTYTTQAKGSKVTRKIRGGIGHMLDNFTIRYADARSVVMDISADWARVRARRNEQRAPWFGFSPNDARKIFAEAQKIFKGNVANLAVRLGGAGRNAAPIWMDPLGSMSEKDKAA